MRKTFGMTVVAAALLLLSSVAFAESYLGRTVLIYRRGHKKALIGKVVKENDDALTVKLPYGELEIRRGDIVKIVDGEKLLQTHRDRAKTCQTAENWYQLGMWALKNNFRKLWREDMQKAIKIDKDHAKARAQLGFELFINERGQKIWSRRKKVKDLEKKKASRDQDRDSVADRPWEDNEAVYYFPEGSNAENATYAIHTNCSEKIAKDYGNFMVKMKKGLTEMVVGLKLRKPVQWQNFGPGKVYICNSHKLFMEITGMSPNVGGFFTPGYCPPAGAEKVIVAFHGTFSDSGNTYGVLAHEGTHQLQSRMWKGNFHTRPPWLIEGLAVYFGDGYKVTKKGEFLIDIPRDRLNNLRRGFASNHYIKIRDLLVTPYRSFGGYHYAHGWGLIYWMVHSGQTFSFKGKTFNLKEVFANFFVDNLDKGEKQIWGYFGAASREDYRAFCDAAEEPWKQYLNSLTPPSVGKWQEKNRQKVFVSKTIGFKVELPKGRAGKAWQAVAEVDLKEGELFAVSKANTSMRFTVSQKANSENYKLPEEAQPNVSRILKFKLENLKFYDSSKDQSHADGTAVYTIHYSGKERKSDYNPDPYPEPYRASKTIYMLGKNYFILTNRMDMSDYQQIVDDLGEEEAAKKFDEVFAPVLNGFTKIDED